MPSQPDSFSPEPHVITSDLAYAKLEYPVEVIIIQLKSQFLSKPTSIWTAISVVTV